MGRLLTGLPALWRWADVGDLEVGGHVQLELAVKVDMGPKQRGQATAVGIGHPRGPFGLSEHAFDQSGVEVHQRGLQQVQREHGNLGMFAIGADEVSALAVIEVLVAAVPVLHDLQPFVDLPA